MKTFKITLYFLWGMLITTYVEAYQMGGQNIGTRHQRQADADPQFLSPKNRANSPILEALEETNLRPTGSDGRITRADIKTWIRTLNIYKNLNSSAKSPGCIVVRELVNKSGQPVTSLTAAQVFLISTTCNPGTKNTPYLLFVVKIYNQTPSVTKEIENLDTLKRTPGLTHLNQKYPRLALPEDIYRYASHENVAYVSIIHGAKGQSLYDLFKEHSLAETKFEKTKSLHDKMFLNNLKKPMEQKIFNAAKTLGTNIANLHIRFLDPKTCKYSRIISDSDTAKAKNVFACRLRIHNDLHVKNIFWDGKRIYLIDVEGYGRQAVPGGVIEDISTMLGTFFRMTHGLYPSADPKSYKKIAEKFLKTFYVHYFETYKKQTNLIHYTAIRDFFVKMGWGVAMSKGLNDRDDVAKDVWQNIKEAIIQV